MWRRFQTWQRVTIIIALWLACGMGGAGMIVAFVQEQFWCKGYRQDLGMASVYAVTGPVFLIVAAGISGFAEAGWTLSRRCKKSEKEPIT